MGIVRTIRAGGFPKQSEYVGRKVEVVFHYETYQIIYGTVVRDDTEEPHVMIIKLADGRHILSTECQYRFTEAGKWR